MCRPPQDVSPGGSQCHTSRSIHPAAAINQVRDQIDHEQHSDGAGHACRHARQAMQMQISANAFVFCWTSRRISEEVLADDAKGRTLDWRGDRAQRTDDAFNGNISR